MTPADTLREAATLMRQRAGDATPGPWEADDSGDVQTAWLDHDRPPSPFERATRYRPSPRRVAVDRETGGACTPSDAEHIASWHPAVALAVADWLDKAADNIHEPGFIPGVTAVPALAVAHAYLGVDL